MALFDEFDAVSAKQWKQKIQYELLGADYNETLTFQTLEGITLKPFYHKEDLKNITYPIALPKSWIIGHKIVVEDAGIANQEALEAVGKGVESLYFCIRSATTTIETLLTHIPDHTHKYVCCDFASVQFLEKNAKTLSESKNCIFLKPDSIEYLARTGNWYHDQKKDFETLAHYKTSESLKVHDHINLLCYQQAGANCVQQLAYGLAHMQEYLHHFSEVHKSTLPTAPIFEIGIGSHCLFEIAKLRAMRWLWHTLAQAYSWPETCHIIAVPSIRNKTVIEAHTNSIRSSLECMSAVLGGADMVYNLPHDLLFKNNNESSNRTAWNQLLLLKKEANFEGISDPTKGSYAIEWITKQMAEKALALFKSVEKGKGLLTQLKKGNLQRKIKENAHKEQAMFDQGSLKLTGINTYIDPNAALGIQLEKFPFMEKKTRKTLIEPLTQRRLSEKIERKLLDLSKFV